MKVRRSPLGMPRLHPPEETLRAITPHLRALGITRCADVTRLDRLGIPTFCAVRPEGRVLQVTAGKGLREVEARVSALMEAIELFHAETPPPNLRRASERALRLDGTRVVSPSSLAELDRGGHYTDERVTSWVEGRDLLDGAPAWLPASAAYFMRPTLFHWTTNGLASGNTLLEASLHGLLEVLERDTLSRLCDGDDISFESCEVIDQETLGEEEALRSLLEGIEAAAVRVVLIRAPSPLPLHTFMAVLLDSEPFSPGCRLNFGFGAHLSPGVAAIRAVTEGAQSRLSWIHGARDDLKEALYSGIPEQDTVSAFFADLDADTAWDELEDHGTGDVAADRDVLLGALREGGAAGVFLVELTRPGLPIAVARVLVAGARSDFPL